MNLNKVTCEICGHKAHFLAPHIQEQHDISADAYQEKYGKPVMSELAKQRIDAQLVNIDNSLVEVSIRKLFGITPFGATKELRSFEKPHSTTPIVDKDYHFDKKNLAIILYAMTKGNEPTLLSGPTGSGKSSIIEQVAARLNWGFYRVNCDGDLTRSDFVGQWVLEGKEMVFSYGLLVRAMREGAVLIVDEWDAAHPSVALALQAVLENGKLVITETGEVVEPHANFRIFATANTLGMGDQSGLYNGTQPQNFAQLDRFTVTSLVDYASPSVEKRIISKKTTISDDEILSKIVNYAKLIREAFKKEEIQVTMSTRTLINIAKKLVDFGDAKFAYEVAFINKTQGSDNDFCREIFQRIWG